MVRRNADTALRQGLEGRGTAGVVNGAFKIGWPGQDLRPERQRQLYRCDKKENGLGRDKSAAVAHSLTEWAIGQSIL